MFTPIATPAPCAVLALRPSGPQQAALGAPTPNPPSRQPRSCGALSYTALGTVMPRRGWRSPPLFSARPKRSLGSPVPRERSRAVSYRPGDPLTPGR
ncbi:MAG TPA: hypothetical protein EYP09_08900 [Anaerolineae bacterium]|nr:hypothetical protein [Anaerolineae bacterium]